MNQVARCKRDPVYYSLWRKNKILFGITVNFFEYKSLLAIIDKQVCRGVNMNLRMGYCKQILIDS